MQRWETPGHIWRWEHGSQVRNEGREVAGSVAVTEGLGGQSKLMKSVTAEDMGQNRVRILPWSEVEGIQKGRPMWEIPERLQAPAFGAHPEIRRSRRLQGSYTAYDVICYWKVNRKGLEMDIINPRVLTN